MRTATIGRGRTNLTILHNGKNVSMENTLLSTAQKKAHHMVRDFMTGRGYCERETVAKIMHGGSCVSEIIGLRKCCFGAISIIHK